MATAGSGTSASVNQGAGVPFVNDSANEAIVPPALAKPPRYEDPASPGMRVATVEEHLFEEGFRFDFFQAVRLLEKLYPKRCPIGRIAAPRDEVVRLRAQASLSFPASAIYELLPPSDDQPLPTMIVRFMGLAGPSGVLPRHYTELLLKLAREGKGPEKYALRDWFDLFNHRFLSLFFRAWEKYRFYIPYERKEYARQEPDPFTRCLFSLVGLGMTPLRDRLHVIKWEEDEEQRRQKVLAEIDDLALLHYSGFLAHRPRNAQALGAMLQDYFQLPVRVQQFHGQWLVLDLANQSRLGGPNSNNELGLNLVAGERVWDVQSKIRIRLGPLRYSEFNEFLPDREPIPQRKALFLLAHLVRLYVGSEFDFDVQLVLRKEDVPQCQLTDGLGVGPQLGRNTWMASQPFEEDAEDAVFEGEEVFQVGPVPARLDAG
jgi:type VI secretion system protein ImpH